VQESVQSVCEGSEPPGRNLDPFAAELIAGLQSRPAVRYDIRARRCGEDRYRVAVAARTVAGKIDATVFEVGCRADLVRTVFQRLGGSDRAELEQRADVLTALLGRAQALAHATAEVLCYVAQG
jgi:hypothetical protein